DLQADCAGAEQKGRSQPLLPHRQDQLHPVCFPTNSTRPKVSGTPESPSVNDPHPLPGNPVAWKAGSSRLGKQNRYPIRRAVHDPCPGQTGRLRPEIQASRMPGYLAISISGLANRRQVCQLSSSIRLTTTASLLKIRAKYKRGWLLF